MFVLIFDMKYVNVTTTTGPLSLIRHSLIRQIRYSAKNFWNEFNPIIKLLVNQPIRKPPSAKDTWIQVHVFTTH